MVNEHHDHICWGGGHHHHTKHQLELQKVTAGYADEPVLQDISFTAGCGSTLALIGPNGAGKTTAFNVITGFYTPTEGDVFFNGKKITGVPPHKICGLGMARTFQNIRLFYNETALENVMIGRHVRRNHHWWGAMLGLPGTTREEKEIRQKAEELLERIGLSEYRDELASSLPYGAQRRLEIARALATEPSFLLLDEPAAGMNPQESLELMNFIRQIRDEFNLTILLIEHDMKVVMGVCEHIWVLEYGKLIAEGNAEAVRSNPRVIEAYLGVDVTKVED